MTWKEQFESFVRAIHDDDEAVASALKWVNAKEHRMCFPPQQAAAIYFQSF